MNSGRINTQNLAIMFTDIKGFTSATSGKSREEIERLLEIHDELIRPLFIRYGGKIVKTIGDAFLVTFRSPTDAVLCGIKIQASLLKYNDIANDDEEIEVKIAINAGEVNVRKNDVFGEPVNIAARIEGIAEPGEVYFTDSVYLSMNKKEIPSAEIGHRLLKGIPHEIKVYKVLTEKGRKKGKSSRKEHSVIAEKPEKKRIWQILKWVGIAFVLFMILGAAGWGPVILIGIAYGIYLLYKKYKNR